MKTRWLSVPAAALLMMAVGQASADMLSKDDFLALAKKSGCLACHSIEKKVVGPAWQDVANSYKGKEAEGKTSILGQITNGGKGKWTEVTGGVPMPPYGPRVAEEDRGKLADFILSLAK